MKSLSNKRDVRTVAQIADAFVHTMYFDLELNYIGGRVEQTIIVPDAPDNWETETCKLIPHVRYEYTRVTKENPETSRRSEKAMINQAKKNIRFYAKEPKRGTVLRVVHDPIVIQLPNNLEYTSNTTIVYLEESLGSLSSDDIASKRKTTEMHPHLKKMASKKGAAKSSGHRAK